MAKHNSTEPGIITYEHHNGAMIKIKESDLGDYASGRASQLSALLTVINNASDDSEMMMSSITRSNVQWLAMSLAQEMETLAEIMATDRMRSAAEEVSA